MSLIKILPENLANQIAAGEVVERPASVVKELLENSIDSGAASIAVQIENAGTSLIRVVDNGCGMDADDMLLALERHATSKLTSAEQLSEIKTLGFRGEAVPSIASVSKMTITSRCADAELGNRLEVRFGKLVKVHEMGAAPGTVLEVRNLFGNMPARRKFLKSNATEIAHIDEVVRSYALVNHGIGFSLQVNGRMMFDWDADGDEIMRVRRAMSGATGHLTPLTAEGSGICSVRGYLPAPDPNAGKSSKLWLFVNGRSVKDRVIAHAVAEGMRGFLMKGRRAAGVIYLEVPADQVDVNVHPAKQEVRFRQANLIHKVVEKAVQRAMLNLQQQRKEDLFGVGGIGHLDKESAEPSVPVPDSGELSSEFTYIDKPESRLVEPGKTASTQTMADVSRSSQYQHEYQYETRRQKPDIAVPERSPETFSPEPQAMAGAMPHSVAPELPPKNESQADRKTLFVMPENSETLPPGTRFVGQFMNTYLVFEVETGIAVIDQHAAQERLLFEQLKQAYETREMASQMLMFPEMLELTPLEMETLEQNGSEIALLGLDIDHFGGNSFIIKAVPALMKHVPPVDVFRELMARFGQEAANGRGRASIDNILASMACKAAIKAGMSLGRAEAERLLCQIRAAGIFSHCPHGRPVVKIFSPLDIKKWFSRT